MDFSSKNHGQRAESTRDRAAGSSGVGGINTGRKLNGKTCWRFVWFGASFQMISPSKEEEKE